MKHNELRIGNILKNGIVTGIFTHTNIYVEDEILLTDEIEPMPITEKVLLNFGFEKTKEMIEFFSKTKYHLLTNEYLTFYYYPEFEGIENLNYNHIRYVHQLQNLYFALVGFELQLLEADA